MRRVRTLLLSAAGALAACTGPDRAAPTAPPAPSESPLGAYRVTPSFTTGASVDTDRDAYAPGQAVKISGTGWAPGEKVTIELTQIPNVDGPIEWDVTADANGKISDASFTPAAKHLRVLFDMTATGATSGTAYATFETGDVGSAITLQIGPADIGTYQPLSWSLTAVCKDIDTQYTCARAGATHDGPVPDDYSYSLQVSSTPDFLFPNVVVSSRTKNGVASGESRSPTSPGTYYYRVLHMPNPLGGTYVWQRRTSNVVAITVTQSDQTPPVITPNVTGTPGAGGWYTGDVTVTWTVADGESTVSSQTGCGSTSVTTDDGGRTITCSATSGGGTTSRSVTIKRDATAPTIALASRLPAANSSGWNNGDVTVSWSCTDATSGAVNATVSRTVSTEGQDQSATGTCTDAAGNTAQATEGGVNIDRTAPTLSPSVAPSSVPLNGSATASPNATDERSGVATATCSPVSTGTLGTHTLTCTATDAAGNSRTASATYQVTYAFGDFQAPINGGGTLNLAKAGQVIPLKWQLADAAGAPVTNLTAVALKATRIPCPAGGPTDPVESSATTTGAGLQNLGGGLYQLNWNTVRSYAGSCQRLQLDLGDGAPRTVDFQFR